MPSHGQALASGADPGLDPLATIEIAKEYLNFSAGHFTIFSATERENLHGHNWRVGCEISTPIGEDGLCFDYAVIKKRLMAICDELDERVLLPAHSPHLQVIEENGMVIGLYADERIPFLPRDVLVLDLRNVTVEDLAGWFVKRLLAEPDIAREDIRMLKVRVSSGTNQWAAREWRRQA
ncbi:MAG: 6-carboxytetrahydropterin synthase [Pseudomonadales bacterium]|jgi:6-pyruvoyltetrahydropterin/6-carboxytetrahydropterin synthase|nr:6-carboxytetrahydropterin synthase [Pseudomonadales bacterium]